MSERVVCVCVCFNGINCVNKGGVTDTMKRSKNKVYFPSEDSFWDFKICLGLTELHLQLRCVKSPSLAPFPRYLDSKVIFNQEADIFAGASIESTGQCACTLDLLFSCTLSLGALLFSPLSHARLMPSSVIGERWPAHGLQLDTYLLHIHGQLTLQECNFKGDMKSHS